jgi:glutamate--cysteine ligase
LFPPVRPRGFLEVRYLDAQSARWWRVAAATVWALAEDERAGDEAAAAAEPVSGRWIEAARCGTSDPVLRRAAYGCLAAAGEGLLRLGEPGPAGELENFLDAYTARGRCPADDLLDDLPALGRPAALDALEVLP